MTVAEAAAVWIETKLALEELEPKLKEAADVLKAYFRKNGKADYKGRISYSRTGYRSLDTKALRAHLGADIEQFETRREREALSLLP